MIIEYLLCVRLNIGKWYKYKYHAVFALKAV